MCSKDGFFQKFEVFDKEFQGYMHTFLKKVNIMQIVPKIKIAKIQKMIKKYNESQYNLAICSIVYTLFYKNKKIFFFFFKPWYNWYKLKNIVIPIVIRSFLYPYPWYNVVQLVQLVKNLVIPTN